LEERIFQKTPVREKEERLRVSLEQLCGIIGSGSNDEHRAAQSPATPVSPRGRTKSVSEEISLMNVSSDLRAGETYL
jgi:hypothetical protein